MKHVILPLLGVVAFLYPLWSVAKPGQAWPYNLVFWIVIGWIVVGIGLFLYFRKNAPDRIAALGTYVNDDQLLAEVEGKDDVPA